MANTYKQAYFHLVFAVARRNALISKDWRPELEKYITGVIQNNGHKLIAIGAVSDHIHILIGYSLNQLVPELVERIKTSSSKWIEQKNFSKFKFNWQIGYGAFTHSHSQLDNMVYYILNQEQHHSKKTFREEYIEMLRDFQIAYKDEYLFDFFDDVDNP
jgi:putative transposase